MLGNYHLLGFPGSEKTRPCLLGEPEVVHCPLDLFFLLAAFEQGPD